MKKRIMPTAYFLALLLLLIVVSQFYPEQNNFSSPYTYAGFILIFFGIFINLWTDQNFKSYKTTVKPQEEPTVFIDKGPFKISRNPMYLGMVAILFGTAVAMGYWFNFVFPIIFIIIIEHKFIPMEEKNMLEKFGDKYIQYKNKVRRWI